MGLDIAFIGYGEVGRTFSRELIAAGAGVSAYDILFDDPARGPAMIDHAKAAGVRPRTRAAEAACCADIVISAVTASESAPSPPRWRAISHPARSSSTSTPPRPTPRRPRRR